MGEAAGLSRPLSCGPWRRALPLRWSWWRALCSVEAWTTPFGACALFTVTSSHAIVLGLFLVTRVFGGSARSAPWQLETSFRPPQRNSREGVCQTCVAKEITQPRSHRRRDHAAPALSHCPRAIAGPFVPYRSPCVALHRARVASTTSPKRHSRLAPWPCAPSSTACRRPYVKEPTALRVEAPPTRPARNKREASSRKPRSARRRRSSPLVLV